MENIIAQNASYLHDRELNSTFEALCRYGGRLEQKPFDVFGGQKLNLYNNGSIKELMEL